MSWSFAFLSHSCAYSAAAGSAPSNLVVVEFAGLIGLGSGSDEGRQVVSDQRVLTHGPDMIQLNMMVASYIVPRTQNTPCGSLCGAPSRSPERAGLVARRRQQSPDDETAPDGSRRHSAGMSVGKVCSDN